MTAEAPVEPEDRKASRVSRGSKRPVLAWAAVATAICAGISRLEPNLLEEGLILHLAERMIEGEQLFVDLASFTGPLPFELLALLFRLLGKEIEVARMVIAILSGISCAAVFALVRRAGLGPWAHVAGAAMASTPVFFFPLHSIYFYSTIAYHLVLIACYAGLRGIGSGGWAFTAGALAAGVALTKQSVGILVAPGLVLAILACSPPPMRLRAGLATVMGGFAVTMLTLVYYGAGGALAAMVDSLVFLPLTFEDAFGSPFINFWPLGEFSPELRGQSHFYTPFVYSILRGAVLRAPSWSMTFATQILYGLPFLALLATGLRRARGKLDPAIWFHAVALFALVSNLFPRTDWGHLVYCAGPAIIQIVLLLPARASGKGDSTPSFFFNWQRPLAWLIVACTMGGAFQVGRGLWEISEPPDLGDRISMRVVSGQYRGPALGRVIAYLDRETEPGEAIFVPRSEPLVYFATGTRNPTRYSGVIPGMLEVQQSEILAALADVRFVVMSEIDQPVFTVYRELLPGVEAYFERHFKLPEEFQKSGYDWIVVFERGVDRGATAIDLMAIQGKARNWIRTPPADALKIRIIEDELPVLATIQNRSPMPMWVGAYGGGIDYEIEVPEDGVFQADVGLAEIRGRRRKHPRRIRFSISVSVGGPFKMLSRQEVLRDKSEGSQWVPFEVDLAAYAGRHVTLRLEATPLQPPTKRQIVWWGSPRLISQPD